MKNISDIVNIEYAGTILLMTAKHRWDFLDALVIVGKIAATIAETIRNGDTAAVLADFSNADFFDDEKNVKRILHILLTFFRDLKGNGLRRVIFVMLDSNEMDEKKYNNICNLLIEEDLEEILYVVTSQQVRSYDRKGNRYCVYSKICPDFTNKCLCEFGNHERKHPEVEKFLKNTLARLLKDVRETKPLSTFIQ